MHASRTSPFAPGDWPASRKVMRHTLKTFTGTAPVLLPSGPCAAMLRHGALLGFEKEADLPEVKALAERTWRLAGRAQGLAAPGSNATLVDRDGAASRPTANPQAPGNGRAQIAGIVHLGRRPDLEAMALLRDTH